MEKINVSTIKHPNTFTLVDNENYEYLSQWKWKVDDNGYVSRRKMINYKSTKTYMHRTIMDCPKGMCIDHINFNPSDNRKSNLRVCTNSENNIHKSKHNNKNTSKYKGVHKIPNPSKPWKAQIKFKYKGIHLGNFKTKEGAAKMYNCAASILFGQFAYLNKGV